MKVKKGVFYIIFAVIVGISIAGIYALLVPNPSIYYLKQQYDPATQICLDRKAVACEDGLCFSCWSVFIQDFPECCANWTDRPHQDRFAACTDEMFYAQRAGLVTDLNASRRLFVRCLSWDKQEFLDKIKLLQSMQKANQTDLNNSA